MRHDRANRTAHVGDQGPSLSERSSWHKDKDLAGTIFQIAGSIILRETSCDIAMESRERDIAWESCETQNMKHGVSVGGDRMIDMSSANN